MPVYPQLQQRIEEISLELNNFQVVTRNITQADNIRREAGVSLEQLCDAISEAHRATRIALAKGTITKKDEAGRPVSMPYFFTCLRQKLGLTNEKAM